MKHYPSIYLSGIIDGATEQEKQGWRDEVKSKWSGRCFDPTIRDFNIVSQYREIVESDLREIEQTDVLLAMYSRPSVGTSMEIVIAHKLGKPVVIIWNPKIISTISPWCRYFASVIVPNVDAALEWIGNWHQQQQRKPKPANAHHHRLRNCRRNRSRAPQWLGVAGR